MGRLNYSARKILGLKAGQTVSKDVNKRFPGGSSYKTAGRDPSLEIDITSKELTDEGFAAFIDDLIKCIKFRDPEHPEGLAKVQEFKLRGNKLTSSSLPKLAEVIKLSSADLRELDLSENDLSVKTAEDKENWTIFLHSFATCFLLRKLDLSGNPLATAGVELFARAYMSSELDFVEEQADEVLGEATFAVGAEVDESEHALVGPPSAAAKSNDPETESPARGKAKKYLGKGRAPVPKVNASAHILSGEELKKFACTRGLRSIPHLIIRNIEITASGAVHLARILQAQKTPDHLFTFLPQGKTVTLPDVPQECKGSLIWLPNEGLSKHARRLLDLAEVIRGHKYSTDFDQGESSNATELEIDHDHDPVVEQKYHSQLETEYSRLMKRVRMEAIQVEGVHSNELWSKALQMMVKSRALLLDDKDRSPEASIEVGSAGISSTETPCEDKSSQTGQKCSDPGHAAGPKEVARSVSQSINADLLASHERNISTSSFNSDVPHSTHVEYTHPFDDSSIEHHGFVFPTTLEGPIPAYSPSNAATAETLSSAEVQAINGMAQISRDPHVGHTLNNRQGAGTNWNPGFKYLQGNQHSSGRNTDTITSNPLNIHAAHSLRLKSRTEQVTRCSALVDPQANHPSNCPDPARSWSAYDAPYPQNHAFRRLDPGDLGYGDMRRRSHQVVHGYPGQLHTQNTTQRGTVGEPPACREMDACFDYASGPGIGLTDEKVRFKNSPSASLFGGRGTEAFKENFPALQADTASQTKNLHGPERSSSANSTKGSNYEDTTTVETSPSTIILPRDQNWEQESKGSIPSKTIISKSKKTPIGHRKSTPRNFKQTWRFGLSLEMWRSIIADAVEANGVLSVEQQLAVIRYAADWEAVSQEMTIQGALEYQQVWKFLETVGCFTYGVV